MGHDMTTPLWGTACVSRLGLAMINVHTKCKVSMFTHYADVKGDAKCRDWGGLGVRDHPRSSAVSLFNTAHTTSHSILIETVSILY